MPSTVMVSDTGADGLKTSMGVGGAEINNWTLKAKSRTTMVTGLHLSGEKRWNVIPGYEGFVIAERWASKNQRDSMAVGPLSAVAKVIADKVQHVYVVHVWSTGKHVPKSAKLVHKFTGALTCRELAKILNAHWEKEKGGGDGWRDAALDAAGTAAEIVVGLLS